MASNTWSIIDDEFTLENMPELLTQVGTAPYPPWWWVITDGEYDNSIAGQVSRQIGTAPYPPWWWYKTDNDEYFSGFMIEFKHYGALNYTPVETATIPKSLKNIDAFTFENTQITEVTIASDCTYTNTSFPEGIQINTYPD